MKPRLVTRLAGRRPVRLLVKAVASFQANDGLAISGYLAYSVLLSLFPFMIFLAALTNFLDESGDLLNATDWLYRFAPTELLAIIQPVMDDVLETRQETGIVTLGVITALWAASSGVEALRRGLNNAYHATETRSFFRRRLQSIGMVLLAALTMMVMSLAIVAGPLLIELADSIYALDGVYALLWNIARYVLALVVMIAALSAFYRYLPNHGHRPAWEKAAIPGALFSTLVWLALATGFSLYLSTRGQGYSLTYGSLAGAIVLMLFFHLSAMIVFLGGELNAMLVKEARDARPKGREEGEGPP